MKAGILMKLYTVSVKYVINIASYCATKNIFLQFTIYNTINIFVLYICIIKK